MVVELHVLALACYVLTAGLVAASLVNIRRRRTPDLWVLAVGSSGAALHFAGLLAYARVAGTLPLVGTGPALSSLAFLVGLLGLAIQGLTRESAIALAVGPLVALLVAAALATGFGPIGATGGRLGIVFVAHVTASLLGLALLAVASAAGALYLLQHRQLKGRRFGVIFQFFPPLEQLDRLNHLTLVVGFPVLTVGILLALGLTAGGGALAVVSIEKLAWAATSWLTYGLLAGARAFGALRGIRAAYVSVAAFLLVAFGYLGVRVFAASGTGFMP